MTPTALYRHFDAAENLLYVGISMAPLSRTRQHSHRADWFIEVVRIDVEWFGTRGDAEQAEWVAIKEEHPLHNKAFAKRAPAPIEQFVILNASGREVHAINLTSPISATHNVPSIIARHKQMAMQSRQERRDSIAETIASFKPVI